VVTPQDILDRRERAIAVLTEQGLELCADLKDAALMTEDLHAKAELALAFQRVGRAVRQGLALEAKLLWGEGRLEREQERERTQTLEAEGRAARDEKTTKVRSGVHRLIWTEGEREELDALEIDELIERTDKLIDFDAATGALQDEPLDAAITRLAREVGLKVPHKARPAQNTRSSEPGPSNPDYYDSA